METIKGYVFDKNGQRITIDNVDIFVSEMKDRLLVNTYRYTIYQNALITEVNELIKKGLIIKEDGIEYDESFTINSIKSMREEIIERFDEDYHNKVIKSIDLSFLDNKPKNV